MRIRVGDPSIDWLALQSQSDEKKVLLVEGGSSRSIGMISEEIVLTEIAGRPALHRSQILSSDEIGNRTAETIVFRETFNPHSHLDISDNHTISITYQVGKVVGEKQLASGEIIPIETIFHTPVFDSHSIEMVLRLLPLTEDFNAELPIFHADKGLEMVVSAKVLGNERVTNVNGLVDSWKVQTDWNGVIQYYWISIENRDLVKQTSIIGEGVQLEFVRV